MVTSAGPSKTVLQETPVRSLRFLASISKYPAIRERLASRGYSEEDHNEGWALFLRVTGYRQAPPAATRNEAVVAGVAELDAWVEPNVRIVRATLERHYPEQASFVLAGLENGSGTAAVVTVVTLLDRLDLLQSSPEREATREADQAALAMLARRGLGPDERTRLRNLTGTVLSPEPAAPAAVSPLNYEQALRRLRAWYAEWSEVARAVITRRDHLIVLGLARRRNSAEKDPPAPQPPAPPTTTTQTPATTPQTPATTTRPPATTTQASAGASQPLSQATKRSARPSKRSARPSKRSVRAPQPSAHVTQPPAETAQTVSPPAPAAAGDTASARSSDAGGDVSAS
jgi:outer membrane biosynthesis protein TonB